MSAPAAGLLHPRIPPLPALHLRVEQQHHPHLPQMDHRCLALCEKGVEARALNARFGEKRECLQALAWLKLSSKEMNNPEQPAFGPFAPPPSSWPILREHYVYHARGPRRAAEHTSSSMRHLGLGDMWVANAEGARCCPRLLG
ncbi:hypothetical protein CALVIDRAFT_598487 [Calocera viscosa TUFC12733]|uniref:Uncharacterized protein n=1 Tax=Calocera viscosa (strain TUFC12733) TaxID=1330018 RepID=A0A167LYF0_CALVF|nr:hypothetical protein CALVIDRAFT_598487 [Calocera viscosa TUFC12733]